MRLFSIQGGVHPEYRKERTQDGAILSLPIPKILCLPLQQHVGAPAEPVVSSGQWVKKGQLLAAAHGSVSAPIHAPTSGYVVDIVDHMAPHPSGLTQKTIMMRSNGKDEWCKLPEGIADPFSAAPQEIAARVAEAGVVGLGGAAFPSSVKLSLRAGHSIDMLLLNGAECEPYLTCDDRVMREYAEEVIDGARIIAHSLNTKSILVAIEDNKLRAIETMSRAGAPFGIKVIPLPARYPMGSAHHLVKAVTGREPPAHGRTAAVGVLVHNVGTARAVHHAVRFGRPLISRVITVSGGALARAHNIDVLLGTLVSDLIDFCGGYANDEPPYRVIIGGPMMGQSLPALEVPVVKGTCGILALTVAEANEQPPEPCIRCGACVEVCPNGLMPLEMAAYVRKDMLEDAAHIKVQDCMSCGGCSYICPSHIPLMHYFEYAKGRLKAHDSERRRHERTKKLAEARHIRLEKQARAKAEAKANKARSAPNDASPQPPMSR